jgi:rubrerythrin
MPPTYDEEPAGKDDLFARGDEAPEEEAVELDFGEDLEEEWDDDDEEFVYECPECGGEVGEDDLTCPHCGAEFEE